jgi:tetratricopeptide (TPR) repeat protein
MRPAWIVLWLCLWLAACADAPPPAVVRPDELFIDQAFTPASERIDARDVFALSEPMRHYLHFEIAGQLRRSGVKQGLVEALIRPDRLKLEYDSAGTRTAAQAFEARAGNCLSLVIMTAALAKELQLSVEFQSAYLEETWSRSGGFYLRSGHVNVTLGHRTNDGRAGWDPSNVTIDFLPPEEIRGLRTRLISEATVTAMFMNDRAAEALVQGRVDDAYWWAREAIVQDPGFWSAYNTLGVVYLHHEQPQAAERALARVLEHQPDNTRAMYNLARVYTVQKRQAEADALYARIAQIEPAPPFHFFNLGVAAMQRQDFKTARDLFQKEVARADYYHEFHYWLGLANFRLGDYSEARKQLALAIENSPARGERDLYAAKLAWLRSQQH